MRLTTTNKINITTKLRKILFLCALIAGMLTGRAQTAIDNFTVGPYIVDYLGDGDVKYRLRDNIDLYEFFEIQPDTVFVSNVPAPVRVKSAVQINLKASAGIGTSKVFGLQGQYKLGFAGSWFFNAGASFDITYHHKDRNGKYTMFEIGIPLEVEYGKMEYGHSSLYALAGVTPTYYKTLSASNGNKKSEVYAAPHLEIGGNLPVGNKFLRIGAFAAYNICDKTYRKEIGRAFIGGKIGFIF